MKVAVIGHGRLGQFIAKKLAQDFDLGVYDESPRYEIPSSYKISLKEIKQYKLIILAVPINQMSHVCSQIAPLLTKDQIIIDTCSVKIYPIQILKDLLPSDVQILGTHPMFGPDSAKKTLWGSRIVLCPERINKKNLEDVKVYLEDHGIKVIEATPEEHDKNIAETLILTHFIGRGLISFGAKTREIDTKGHRRLIKILETVENDSLELFYDMNKYNPFAKKMRDKWISALKEIDNDCHEKN